MLDLFHWRKLIMHLWKYLFIFCVISSTRASRRRDHLSWRAVSSMSSDDTSKITLDEVLEGKFNAESYNGEWISDKEIRTISKAKITVTNVETNAVVETDYTKIIDALMEKKNSSFSSVSFSADGMYLLITHSRVNLWRSSYTAKYDILNLSTNQIEVLQPPAVIDQPDLQLVRWGPTGNNLAFVHENDLYYRSSAKRGTEIKRITSDGEKNKNIFNGHTDWIYEEEMFGTNNALWFSPNGDKLAYIQFNDTDVDKFTYTKYGEPGNKETVYPKQITIPYPKSGRTNPKYSVFVVQDLNAATLESNSLTFNNTEEPEKYRHYIGTTIWATNSDLVIVTLDRSQRQAITYRCPTYTANIQCRRISAYTENSWVDVVTPKFNKAATKFLTLQYTLQKNSENLTNSDYFKHIVLKNGKTFKEDYDALNLTSGNFNVNSILAWDETSHKIYFSGTHESDPGQRHIYYVHDNSTLNLPYCITCGFRNANYTREICLSNSATFSPGFNYYIHNCLGPNVPSTVIRRTVNNSIAVIALENSALRRTLSAKIVPIKMNYNLPLANGFVAKVRLILPPDFSQNSNHTYPLLIDVYAGPGSQKIGWSYGIDWGTSLVSSKNIVYGFIDGRGSGYRRKSLLDQLSKKFGTVEIEDQISVTKQLFQGLKFIDPTRTAIWGWSYGGYATAMVMSKDTEGIFKCGISVAPVTNWLYYDTIYTERYMKYPTDGDSEEDNWDGYNASDVTTQVENFKNKNFLLIHGNADDNVHYQQSMLLARALEKKDIMFHQLSYPDESHSINGQGMRRHLYHSLEKFLFSDECFGQQENEDVPTTTAEIITTSDTSASDTTSDAYTSDTTTTESGGSFHSKPLMSTLLYPLLLLIVNMYFTYYK